MLQKAGRIAFREEGDYWNAYFADKNTMQGAVLLGSIRLNLARDFPALKAQFMALMREVFNEAAGEVIGTRPVWLDPQPAPEHERTKK